LLISTSFASLDGSSSKSSLFFITESFCDLLDGRFGMLVPALPSSLLVGRLGSTMPIVPPLM
jgi:hypothetical protein